MRTRLILLLLFFAISKVGFTQTLEEKIGQMIMVGFGTSQTANDSLMYDIEHRNLGGVLMFGYNLRFPSQIKAQNQRLTDAAPNQPLFIAIDQEGGIVARLDERNGYKETYSAYDLGYTFNLEDTTRATAALMAHWLSESGFNINFAPVVDVNVNPQSPAIGNLDRSFSNNEFEVYQHSAWYIDEFQKSGILSSLKHFPGHGSAVNDSHLGFTDISNTWEERELDPFELLIDGGFSDFVMTGHLFKSDWDSDYPASLSHYAITSILRDSLNFEGLVITDELFMNAIQNNYGMEEAIVATINAGTDILLFSNNFYDGISLPNFLINLISEKVATGDITESRIDEAYNRIVNMKQQRLVTSTEENISGFDRPQKITIGNYPNPFNPATTVLLTLLEPQTLTISIYNSIGQQIKVLQSGRIAAGSHSFRFGAGDLTSGVYFVKVSGENVQQVHRMLLVK